MNNKQKKELIKIGISLLCFVVLLSMSLTNTWKQFDNGWIYELVIYLFVFLFTGYEIILKSFRNIIRGKIFDENFLMLIASVGAFAIKEYPEAIAVLIFYQVGEFFESYAVNKSRNSISSLMDIRPDYANVYDSTLNDFKIVDPSEVKDGQTILVKPGEKIPLDGVVKSGKAYLDTKALTGESLPQEIYAGNAVLSGSIVLNSSIEITVSKLFYDSTVSKILELVENATTNKAKTENFITKFAKFYTPIVVLSALCLFLISGGITSNWSEWLNRSLNFLVVSCPCALVISVPLTFFSGIGLASKKGILIKGSDYIEKLNKTNIFLFDKTGTLTKGNFKISSICSDIVDSNELLYLAASAEQLSNHPIALSIQESFKGEVIKGLDIEEITGKGIRARKEDLEILCGNYSLLKDAKIECKKIEAAGTIIYVAKNDKYLGYIVISDEIKEESYDLIKYLNDNNYTSVMLTGDNDTIAKNVCESLSISKYHANLLPQDKAVILDEYLKNKNKNDEVCFVGDGINDTLTLVKADVGISMGNIGSDAAIEASDVVLMYDDLSMISYAKKIAKKVMILVHENIWFALAIKLLILILSSLGYASMWVAVFADVGVSFLCILNSFRVNLIKDKKKI